MSHLRRKHGAEPSELRLLCAHVLQDMSRGGEIVTFSTSVRSGDCLMSMWCGTGGALGESCTALLQSAAQCCQHGAWSGTAAAQLCSAGSRQHISWPPLNTLWLSMC